jgi:hypothetical protein
MRSRSTSREALGLVVRIRMDEVRAHGAGEGQQGEVDAVAADDLDAAAGEGMGSHQGHGAPAIGNDDPAPLQKLGIQREFRRSMRDGRR